MGVQRAMVLGASGFIGRTLVRQLAASGVSVVSVGRAASHSDRHGPFATYDGSRAGLAALIATNRADVIFNLASAGVLQPLASDLDDGNSAIVDGVFDGAPDATVIHAGSWSQYDPALMGSDPVDEATPQSPSSPYGKAKQRAERTGFERTTEKGRFVSLRLFNVYGSEEAPSRLLPHIVRGLTRGEHVELTTGTQRRDFVHVDDVASAFRAVAADPPSTSVAFNVCTGVATAVRDIALMAADELGASEHLLDFGALPQRPFDPQSATGSPQAIEKSVGWKPIVSVDAGVRRVVRELVGKSE